MSMSWRLKPPTVSESDSKSISTSSLPSSSSGSGTEQSTRPRHPEGLLLVCREFKRKLAGDQSLGFLGRLLLFPVGPLGREQLVPP
ncbi:hypothetical protein HYQ46_002515 [Verticillium longisporum]|nr:hypothetical protein HYQ46_002515 [Verticillium longisporum]